MSLGERNNVTINVAICHFIAISLNTWRPYSSCTESRPLKYTRYISNWKVFAYIAELLWAAELSPKHLRSVCGKGKQRRWGDVGRWGAVRWTTAIVFMMLRTVWTPRKDEYVIWSPHTAHHHGRYRKSALPDQCLRISIRFSLQTTTETEKQLQEIVSSRRASSQLVEHKHEINWSISWMY